MDSLSPKETRLRLRSFARRYCEFAFVSLAAWISLTSRADAQPVAPAVPVAEPGPVRMVAFSDGGSIATASIPASLSVDTASREEARLFFRAIYSASERIPMEWTGNYSGSDGNVAAGDTSSAHKDAVNLRVNFFRAMAGVPGIITFNSTYSAKAQKAALMMSANNALSHTPPANWQFYTTDGYQAASSSNLAIGIAGPAAVDGYIADPGAGNAAVGHRRWVLHPQTRQMGTGDVAGNGTLAPANSLWVFDPYINAQRPFVRESFVAWPAPGYSPYQVVYPRWSISYPNADFAGATVTMTRGGVSLPVTLAPVTNGYGENTLVWVYDNLDPNQLTTHAKPTADTTYNVTVGNVRINGQAQTFTYSVIVFDPDVAGSDHEPVVISGPGTPAPGQSTSFTVGGLYYATGFQWRTLTTTPYTTIEGGENGTSGVTTSTTGTYNVVNVAVKASGAASFQLAHPTVATQSMQLSTQFLGTTAPQLVFKSRLGYASTAQTARAQVSLDNGATWSDVYSQAGTGGAGESSFTQRTVSLATLVGRTFLVRFVYSFSTGSYFPGTGNGIGWYIDDIAISGVSAVTPGASSATQTGNQFALTPAAAGSVSLQARGVFYGDYPLEWGPVKTVSVTAPVAQTPLISSHPASQTVAPGGNVTFSVTASGSPEPTFQWRKNGTPINNATASSLNLLLVQPTDAGNYTVVVTNASGSVTSSTAVLSVDAVPVAPSITAPPVNLNAVAGTTATFSVAASGYPAPTYQWRKGTTNLVGATSNSLSLSNVQSADAGNYSVVITNSQGTVTSPVATLSIFGLVNITSQPASVSIPGASQAALSVSATGSDLTYQWYTGTAGDTGSPIAGAVNATYTTSKLDATTRYWVRVSSPAQTVFSQTAVVTVTSLPRYFFGGFSSPTGGAFALMVRPDNSGVMLAQVSGGAVIEQRSLTVSGSGAFTFSGPTGIGTVNGQITGSTVTGTLSGSSSTFAGAQDAPSGETAVIAGYFRSVIVNSADGDIQVLCGPGGSAFVLAGQLGTRSGATFVANAGGAISGTLPDGRAVVLQVNATTGRVSGTTDLAGATRTVFGARDGFTVDRRVSNISVRAHVRQGDNIMITGFVIQGPGTKQVLIRGVGPTLGTFGVPDVAQDPIVRLYRAGDPPGAPPILENDNWGTASNASAVAAASAGVGAFTLPGASADAALLVALPQGAYTAHVSGKDGGTGAAIVEIYDVDEVLGTAATANLTNISMRGEVGVGASEMIAGFVVTGGSPKRLLIRGVGAELANYGVIGLLSDPRLRVYAGSDEIAVNDSWSAGGQQAIVEAASAQVGAFALTPASTSAAIVIWLAPGAYTTQLSGASGAAGVALVEVYELP